MVPQANCPLISTWRATAFARCGADRPAVFTPTQVLVRGATMRSQCGLRHRGCLPNGLGMASDPADDFRIRVGRSRSRGAGAGARYRPFVKRVEAAIRKAGGNPNRIGRSAGKRSDRFNARGRGAKLSFPKEAVWWQRDSAGRFRARRVVVKARVVNLNPQHKPSGPKMPGNASRAADAHPRYLERDGVTRDRSRPQTRQRGGRRPSDPARSDNDCGARERGPCRPPAARRTKLSCPGEPPSPDRQGKAPGTLPCPPDRAGVLVCLGAYRRNPESAGCPH
jgi:hypothetical protein